MKPNFYSDVSYARDRKEKQMLMRIRNDMKDNSPMSRSLVGPADLLQEHIQTLEQRNKPKVAVVDSRKLLKVK